MWTREPVRLHCTMNCFGRSTPAGSWRSSCSTPKRLKCTVIARRRNTIGPVPVAGHRDRWTTKPAQNKERDLVVPKFRPIQTPCAFRMFISSHRKSCGHNTLANIRLDAEVEDEEEEVPGEVRHDVEHSPSRSPTGTTEIISATCFKTNKQLPRERIDHSTRSNLECLHETVHDGEHSLHQETERDPPRESHPGRDVSPSKFAAHEETIAVLRTAFVYQGKQTTEEGHHWQMWKQFQICLAAASGVTTARDVEVLVLRVSDTRDFVLQIETNNQICSRQNTCTRWATPRAQMATSESTPDLPSPDGSSD